MGFWTDVYGFDFSVLMGPTYAEFLRTPQIMYIPPDSPLSEAQVVAVRRSVWKVFERVVAIGKFLR